MPCFNFKYNILKFECVFISQALLSEYGTLGDEIKITYNHESQDFVITLRIFKLLFEVLIVFYFINISLMVAVKLLQLREKKLERKW